MSIVLLMYRKHSLIMNFMLQWTLILLKNKINSNFMR